MLLKIAIPTFSRNEQLIKCLNSLVGALNECFDDKIKNDVSVYVYDNNNGLELEGILADYGEKLPNFSHIHNGGNIGVRRNIAQCYRAIDSCTFVHVIGDDDAVHRTYFSTIMPLLRNSMEVPFSVVYLNAYSERYPYHFRPLKGTFNQFKYYKCHDFIERLGINLTFISSLIIRADKIDYDNVNVAGTDLGQLHYALESMKYYERCVFVKKYLIVAGRSSDIHGGGRTEVAASSLRYNNLNEIYVRSFYAALREYTVNITRRLTSNHFDKFILFEIHRRKLFDDKSYNYCDLGAYFGDLLTYKLVGSISNGRLRYGVALSIVIWKRVFSEELSKIAAHCASGILFKILNRVTRKTNRNL